MVLELENLRFGTELLKRGFAKMQKGGVIMDVTTPQQRLPVINFAAGGSLIDEGLVSAKNRYQLANFISLNGLTIVNNMD